MAVSVVRATNQLAAPLVLAPERYDPRRSVAKDLDQPALGDIAGISREIVQPSHQVRPTVVLDTADAKEGFIVNAKEPRPDIGSAKKTARAGDVIISRLRPYLRQVAFIDRTVSKESTLLCSTEFFVLRSRTADSIAFLVPFLLSKRVQEALSASQEGGHHPRFQEESLTSLRIPQSLVEQRHKISTDVEELAAKHREIESKIRELVSIASEASS